jgi:hypothetical protein
MFLLCLLHLIVSKALSSEVIQIRNCLQVLLSLEYTLEQADVAADTIRKIDKLLSYETRSQEAFATPKVAGQALR